MDNGTLPNQGVGSLPGPHSDQLWRHQKKFEIPLKGLIEGEFPLTCFFTTALLSKPDTNVSKDFGRPIFSLDVG